MVFGRTLLKFMFKDFYLFFIHCSPPDPKINISQNLLSWDQKLNLALIGSMPNRALRHVRVHWLINMISIKS